MTQQKNVKLWYIFCLVYVFKKKMSQNAFVDLSVIVCNPPKSYYLHKIYDCVKRVRIRSYSGPNFSRIFPLRISPYSLRMRVNAGKMWTRITPNTGSFYAMYNDQKNP